MPTGQPCWYVSVTVAKGAKPGKRVVLVSRVHGDEMSSIHTVQGFLMNQLDPAEMSGTVMWSRTSQAQPWKTYGADGPIPGRGLDLIDMNREWPGNENGATAPSRHAGLLFNRLLRPDADVAIDFHTGTTGFHVTAFNIASMDVPRIKAMVELYPVGQIFANHAYPGVLHLAFVDVGIRRCAGDRCGARPGPRNDRLVRGRRNERPQAPRHSCRTDGTYEQGLGCLHRQQCASGPGDSWRACRTSGQAQRQGRSRTEDRRPAQ